MPQTKVRKATCKSRRRFCLGPTMVNDRRRSVVQMGPGLPRHGVREGGSQYTEIGGHICPGLSSAHAATRFDHHGICQDCNLVLFSALAAVPSCSIPGGFVGSIGRGISCVQVGRVAARRVVAGVTDHFREVSEDQPECDPAGPSDLVFPVRRVDPAELPVSPLDMDRAVPLPTLALKSSVHLGPEAVLKPEPCLGVHRETVPLRHVVRPRKEGEVIHAAD